MASTSYNIHCSCSHTTGITKLTGVTENRRADISPYLNKDDIDPNLGVIGVNDMNGNPLATGYRQYVLLCSVHFSLQCGIMPSTAHVGALIR